MYAIIETGGKQYWVTPGEILQVEKLSAKEGEDITFKALWSASKAGEIAPKADNNAKVVVTVLKHLKGPRIMVFKKRAKKAYEKSRGHRQELSEIKIKDVQLS